MSGNPGVSAAWMVGSGVLHLVLSGWFWYQLLWAKRVIDGGPLGFISWAIPTLAGSLAYDVVRLQNPRRAVRALCKWGAVLAVFGYALSCLNAIFSTVPRPGLARFLVEPPFWPPYYPVDLWTMSQGAGSNSYLWFSAGFSLLVYGAFVWWTDKKGRSLSMFHVLGVNPLAGYIIHGMVSDAVRPFGPSDSPLFWTLLLFGLSPLPQQWQAAPAFMVWQFRKALGSPIYFFGDLTGKNYTCECKTVHPVKFRITHSCFINTARNGAKSYGNQRPMQRRLTNPVVQMIQIRILK